ncbi:MAG: electron transport complex subunit RsxC [Myxococcales bacterium]|nr:electron transport complex subunit RsxC [Myxococcales bacterium]MDD9969050.1 electron transport complex subunit RsxC [Myxococcales bacterium]
MLSFSKWLRQRPRGFRHGTHPEAHKDTTSGLPIEHMPMVAEYSLHLAQHAGAPSRPCVGPGERVRRGQTIAEPDGFRSVALHAPVAGTIRAIEPRLHPAGGLSPALILRTDFLADQSTMAATVPEPGDRDGTLAAIQRAGVVGLGGAAYPAHAKMRIPKDKRVDVVILNGAECEPYLTADHRVMLERAGAVVGGLTVIMELVGAERGTIGVEVNKPDAIDALSRACRGDPRMQVVPLSVKYPEGAKQMLIKAVTGQRVPLGGRSFDTHVTIHNVGTAAALYDACTAGLPMIDRVVTVTGPEIVRPANVRVSIGTPVSALLEHCGGLRPAARRLVMGGGMMGHSQVSLEVPTVKAFGGVLALPGTAQRTPEAPCIRCGKCLDACAMFLNPARLATLSRAGDVEGLKQANVQACFECGSCAFVCPSYLPLTELIRTGKVLARRTGS